MRAQKKQIYRKRLLEQGERLKGGVASLRETALRASGGDASGNLSNAPLHLADLGTDNNQQEVDTGILEQEQQILGAIGSALDRLDAGTYGTCERCGKKISEARLEAIPYASRCISCEEEVEREQDVVPISG
jgi:DnaK suppressor protein